MSGIYIHIPFCKQKCIYCNFYSIRTDKNTIDAYIESLIKEIHYRKDYLEDKNIQTIYFGGGTPSLLNSTQINLILNSISKYFDISSLEEITFEANPECLSEEYLTELKENTIINRLSIGVQSFFDDDLKFLNRKHSAEQSIQSIRKAQKLGFNNISIDLIYGLPSLDNKKWIKNLGTAFDLNVPHISAYALTVEPDTILDIQIRKGKIPDINEESIISHFEILTNLISENGYDHYEISNFAKPDFYSKHNSSYWDGTHYLGLGTSAHSFDGKSRQWNIADINQYIQSVNAHSIFFEKEELSPIDRFNEYIMTGLRTSKGIEKDYLINNFDKNRINLFEKEIEKYIKKDLIVETSFSYRLTHKGKLFADRIAGELFI